MENMEQLLEHIRTTITDTVFVRRGEERFIPETSSWIMDFRRVCLDPGFLDVYTDIFYERFKDRYPFQVGGMEVAAIPLVAAIVMKMRERGLPVNGFFIRKSRKKTGLLKMVEGKITDDPIILVDDLINNGYTLDRQLKVIEEAGKQVATSFTVLRFRSLAAYQKYADRGITIEALFGLDELNSDIGTTLLDMKERKVPEESFVPTWHFRAGQAKLEVVMPKSGMALDAERLYIGSDRGMLYALDRHDGSIVWQHRIGLGPWGSKRDKEIFSTPLIRDGRVYFGAYDGNVYCLDAAKGKRMWVSFEAEWVTGSAACSPDGTLFIPTSLAIPGRKGGLVALDVRTGKARWRTYFPSQANGTPLLVEKYGLVCVGTDDGTLFALDSRTGQTRWSFRSGGAIKDAAVLETSSDAVIFSSFDGAVYRLDLKTGLLIWKFENGLANYAAPLVWRDRVFVASLDKSLYCLERETGKQLWTFPARARIFSSPRMFRARLYVGANDARLYEIDPMTGQQTGFFQAVERITNPIAYDENSAELYLGTYANEVYRLDKN